jgi:CheY-like chemotaxis protein
LPYDLVLMDVLMPEMNGLEATRMIRDRHSAVRNSAIPIVAMTAAAMRGDRERCLEAGMNDYLAKPVALASLVKTLNTWLPQEAVPPSQPPSQPAAGGVAPEVSEPEAPIFDRAGMLERLMDEEMVAIILARFLESAPQQIASLRSLLEAGDVEGATRQAHSLKGAASNVGGERLRQVAFAVERAARAGDLRAAAEHLVELEPQFHQLRAAIQAEGLDR